jgi:hypothetical protein
MNTKLTRREIGRLLDRSAARLDRPTLDGLQAARRHALRRQRVPFSAWLGRNGVLHGHLHLPRRALAWLMAAVVATLLLVNLSYCYHTSRHGDIDIAILTDEMPVDVYVDD